jgi:nucleotide-binding universal stress UspA family protein
MLAEVLVHVPASTAGAVSPAAPYAIGCAAAFGATLTALVYEVEVLPPVSLRQHRPAGAAPHDRQTGDDPAGVAATARAMAAAAEAAGVACAVVTERSYAYGIGESLADYAHLRDLTILDVPVRSRPGSEIMAMAALYQSGRPVVFVPPTSTGFGARTVLIGWDASAQAVRAVHDALPLLKRAERVVVARAETGVDLRPGQSGPELCRHLSRHGVPAEFMPLTSGAPAAALLFAAKVLSADLMVMGAKVHSRLHKLLFGSATEAVLTGDLAIPVLMTH